MNDLWKKVELVEGAPVVYLGVHALRWRYEWGEPSVGFIDYDEREEWISTKSKSLLPKPGKRVQVVIDDDMVAIGTLSDSIDQWEIEGGLYYHGTSFNRVRAWKELSLPPKEDFDSEVKYE